MRKYRREELVGRARNSVIRWGGFDNLVDRKAAILTRRVDGSAVHAVIVGGRVAVPSDLASVERVDGRPVHPTSYT
jgi:hypothetical protein